MKSVIDGYVAVTRKVNLIENSKTGKAVSDQYEKLIEPLRNLERQVPEEISEAADIVFDVPWGIMEKAYRILNGMRGQTRADTEKALEALAAYLDPALVKVSSFVEPLLDPLAAKIHEIDQEMDERISQSLDSLDGQLSFYVKRVEEIRDGLQPLVEEVAKECRLGMETLNKNLKPYLDPLLEEGRKYKDAFKEWVRAPLNPPDKS
ncbi:hypothetical protein JD844_006078 [Phrynosoma platyrhinos]|uniref:Apolipoprotein A-I n=1 Tax=Phrynosoma platyrhinos TaxID=52577 RepID=A0ABQ7TQH7_PHRPL|nr:hypothetical protein JD844_006078 [Phrynosoma platyrhinos]